MYTDTYMHAHIDKYPDARWQIVEQRRALLQAIQVCSVVKCLWEVFIGSLGCCSCRVWVCVGLGGVVLCRCVWGGDLLIFLPPDPPPSCPRLWLTSTAVPELIECTYSGSLVTAGHLYVARAVFVWVVCSAVVYVCVWPVDLLIPTLPFYFGLTLNPFYLQALVDEHGWLDSDPNGWPEL